MAEWFQTKVKFLRQMDNGLIKAVTENYLVDATSFTEAENRIIQEVAEGMKEVTMMSVARSNIREVVMYGDTEKWFKVKMTYVVSDEDSEREKKVTTYLLVNANDVGEAWERSHEYLKEMLVPYQLPKIEETNFVEVYQYQPGLKSGMRKLSPEEQADVDAAREAEAPLPNIQPSTKATGDFHVPKEEE